MSVIGKVENHLGLSTTLNSLFAMSHERHEDSIGLVKRDRLTLVPKDTTGVLTSTWPNPAGVDIIVFAVYLNITTKSTSAATYDIGVAANATTTSDTIFDAVDIGTAAGLFTGDDATGVAGPVGRLMTSTQFITIDAKSDDTGVVGTIWVHWGIA